MTGTQLTLILISSVLAVALIVDGYRILILKKKKLANYWAFFFLIFINYFFLWDADYFNVIEEFKRERNDIPQIEKYMQLGYRSRFKEEWINSDTSKIQHASKIIKLGQSIEKEIDFFTNEIENKTLRIKATFPLFSRTPKKEYALLNGIVKDNDFFEPKSQFIILNEKQKDSVLIEWELIKQMGTTKNIVHLVNCPVIEDDSNK